MKKFELNYDEFKEDMKDIETRMKILRAEYNQYMSGFLKTPPTFTEAQIRKIIRKYAATRGLKGVHRFQYFNLVAKFNTMMEFYNRRIRDIAEGKQVNFGFVRDGQNIATTAKERSNEKPSFTLDRGHVISDVNRQITTVRDMYERWSEYNNNLQTPMSPMTLEKFKHVIQAKTDELRSKNECAAIRYKMVIKDGKISIRAKPIK